MRPGPEWLAELQARFGSVLRTPLDRATGTLTARVALYDAHVVESVRGPSARGTERLAVYNRQYWFRLFDVLQNAFPLTARLLGYWSFNDYAARFLLARPPGGWNIDDVPGGFDDFFAEALECGDSSRRAALVESARVDAAWRSVFAAERTPAYRPSDADASRLLDARLVLGPWVRIVEEHRPLVDVRRALGSPSASGLVDLPPLLPRPRWWAIAAVDDGIAAIPLEPREAELLGLLGERTVRDALSHLERACAVEERALLPEKTRAWLARSVLSGFWSAARFETPQPEPRAGLVNRK